jgi:hypothetical protein
MVRRRSHSVLRIDQEYQRRGPVIKAGLDPLWMWTRKKMPNAEAAKKIYHMNPSVKACLNTVPRSCRLEPVGGGGRLERASSKSIYQRKHS